MKAFISYSHKDAEWLEKIHEHLAALRRDGLLETWTDREIQPGGVIGNNISEKLNTAELFLLLISAAFIDSNYCYEKEFQRMLQRRSEEKVTIIPIIVRECDWAIPELKQFKALPRDGKAVASKHWHSPDEALADVATCIRSFILSVNNQKKAAGNASNQKSGKKEFIPGPEHISAEQREDLGKLVKEIVDRYITLSAAETPDIYKKRQAKFFGIVWSQFNDHFGTAEFGLKSLRGAVFEDAKRWLVHYRASKNSNYKRSNPQKYRNTLTKPIFTIAGKLGWTDNQVHSFAAQHVGYREGISSLNDLGNNQLELILGKIRYEATKLKVRNGQAKARRKPKFRSPELPDAVELLKLILLHPKTEELGLTEILDDSLDGPLYTHCIPNSTARGDAFPMKKSAMRNAVSELMRLGWLLPPEQGLNSPVRVYELNPEAAPKIINH